MFAAKKSRKEISNKYVQGSQMSDNYMEESKMKRIFSLILTLCIVISGFPLSASAASTSKPLEDEVYYIVSALNEKKAVDIKNASSSNSANIQLYDYNETGAQRFKLTYKDGYYTITNINSGKVIDVQGGGTKSGTNIQQYDSNNTDAQKWRIVDLGNGYYSIQAKCGLYLDVQGGNTTNGTNIQIYNGNGTKSQMFKFVPFVDYQYTTVKYDCSSFEVWKSSLQKNGKQSLPGVIVAQNVISYKTVKMKIPVYGPNTPEHTSYRTISLKLPYEVKYKLHNHTLNQGFGRSWYYTNNGIQMVETCNCGYRSEQLFWEIPDLTESASSQTTKSVISGLPQF